MAPKKKVSGFKWPWIYRNRLLFTLIFLYMFYLVLFYKAISISTEEVVQNIMTTAGIYTPGTVDTFASTFIVAAQFAMFLWLWDMLVFGIVAGLAYFVARVGFGAKTFPAISFFTAMIWIEIFFTSLGAMQVLYGQFLVFIIILIFIVYLYGVIETK